MCWHRGKLSEGFQWHCHGKEIIHVTSSHREVSNMLRDFVMSKFGLIGLVDILV